MTLSTRAMLENIGRNFMVVGVEPITLVKGKPLTSKWNNSKWHSTPFETILDRSKTEAEHRNSLHRSFEGGIRDQVQKSRSKTMTNFSSDFLDLNKVRLRFLKDKDQEDSARRSDGGSLLKTQMESVQSAATSRGAETISQAERLTVSYSIGYSSGVISQSQRPNTAVATDDLSSDYENHPAGYGTPGEDDASTCFTSRHPTRCSTAWSLTSGTRTTSAKQPCSRIPDSGLGNRGTDSGNSRREIESDKYRRTCSNELMNVITIDDGVFGGTKSNDEEPCNESDIKNGALEIQTNAEQRLAGRSSASSKADKRRGRVDTHRPIRSRDDLLRLIDRAMTLSISGSQR